MKRTIHSATDPALAARRLRAMINVDLLRYHGVNQDKQPIQMTDPSTRAEKVEVIGRLQLDRMRYLYGGHRRGDLALYVAATNVPFAR